MVKELRLETKTSQDRHVRGNVLFLSFEFSDTEMAVSLGPRRHNEAPCNSKLWSHTVYELEKFSGGLRFVASGELPPYYEIPSPDVLIGPAVVLFPALEFQLGHPGVGEAGRGIVVYASSKHRPLAGRRLVELDGISENRAEHATFEVKDVLEFADELYQVAKDLAFRFQSDEDDAPLQQTALR